MFIGGALERADEFVSRVDPFLVNGPAVVSFSGGRTSAYMLARILRAHGGRLPDDIRVVYANTGREADETLDFVRDCGAAWGVDIDWVEYRHEPRRPHHVVVDYASASRHGEPFNELLRAKRIVPDASRRFCTGELKVGVIKRHLRSLGWNRWTNVVGLRADESVRVDRRLAAEARPSFHEPWKSAFPLFDGGIELMEILRFWKSQPFDLALKDASRGNCDGCFMKSSAVLARLFREMPERMQWWVGAENTGRGKTFSKDRSYAEIARAAAAQVVLPYDDGAPCEMGCGI